MRQSGLENRANGLYPLIVRFYYSLPQLDAVIDNTADFESVIPSSNLGQASRYELFLLL